MPSDSSGTPPTLVLLGPAAWAAQAAAALGQAVPGAVTRTCTDPAQLPALLPMHGPAAILAHMGAGSAPAPLARLVTAYPQVPLTLAAAADVSATTLLEVMGAGATGLARADDGTALAAAVRRAFALPAAPAATGAASADAGRSLCALADRVEQPLALVRDARVVHLNPTLQGLLGLTQGNAFVQRPLADFAAPESVKPLAALLARALLLDLDDKTRETLRFVPQAGPAFTAEVTATPLAIDGGQGLAVALSPSNRGDTDGLVAPRGNDRLRLLQRLGVLTDDASPVERSSALALAVVADYADHRSALGFDGAAELVQTLADCLRAAAPADSGCFIVAEDSCALLVEDLSTAELDQLRRRLRAAPAESDQPALRQLRLRLGLTRVAPGVGAPADVLDRAVADAWPIAATDTVGTETTEGLDLLAPGDSTDLQHSAPLHPAGTPVPETPASGAEPPRLSLSAHEDAGETVVVDDLAERIQRALATEGFTLALQPIISLLGDSREHYSVLLRLRRPDGTLASAGEIIRSAAASGRMADIDRWMIRSALRLLSQRRRIGEHAAFFISLSADLVADEHLLIWICDALREFDIRGSWLTFQMREQDAQAQPERWADLVAGLREIRCRICVNQHGLVDALDSSAVGRPDFVKLAPALAAGLSADKDKQQHLLELIRLARARDIRSIITGVEDSRALNLLWDAGIEYVQGDYLQPPTTSLDLPQDGDSTTAASGPDSERLSLRL
ncbi:EAL domain-containing protein [uncultured Thiohalocapsa sp.]|uniref:EAL domain-containing protein n=1 Tax=uncultured Thiohalocapsa sp. TaxID=768990 RepID=UPI0025CE1DC7|nr:EAL domain-containing protein [uncultured Thiohalocapsa sp.]